MNSDIECSIMCRACMKVDGVLLPMYGDDIISKKNLPDKLANLASIHIDKYDGLPAVLCAKCAYRTDAFYDFKLQVQATEKKLRKMFQCSNSQNIAPKAEIAYGDWKNNDNSDSDERPKVESWSTSTRLSSCNANVRLEDKVELDAKLADEEERSFEEAYTVDCDEQYVESEATHMANSAMEDNEELSALQSLDHIFISDIHDMIDERRCESQGVKNEASDDTDDVLQSESLGYTLLYIPAEEGDHVDAANTEEQMIHLEDRSEVSYDDRKMFEHEIAMENIVETDGPNDTASWNVEVLRTSDELTSKTGKWTTNLPYDTIVTDDQESVNPKFIKKKSNNRDRTHTDDDSDSDYFVDPHNNILGSLNDTIMRIKEIKLNASETLYQCTLCLQNYDNLTGVLNHTVDNHIPTNGPFYCVICEKDCESIRDLRSHVKIHSGRYPYSCFICGKAYSMKRYLKRHMSCHADFPRHRCPKCGLRFNLKTELETHLSTHVDGGAPFACSQCPRVFNHKGNFKRHLISHLDPRGLHLPKYPCEICGKRFSNNRTLSTHMRVHTGEKPFQCDICNRSFSQQGNLLNHLRIHSNPRSYTCEVCGKRFNQRATLRDHSLLHTGEKPYVCTVCGVAFTFSAALRRHMWTHAADKPFGCEICNARFVGKYDMRRHMKTHAARDKTKRRRNRSGDDRGDRENSSNEISRGSRLSMEDPNASIGNETIVVEESEQSLMREETEKENVDALFNLIQYG